MTSKTYFAFLLTLVTVFSSAVSLAAEQFNDVWSVSRVEGHVQFKAGDGRPDNNSWNDITAGSDLTAPVYIRTGSEARVVLMHRNDKVTIAPNSLLKLKKEKSDANGILTKVFQQIGYAIFDIETNSGRTNLIETPYLVSVVKGTVFTVQVGTKNAAVNLLKGRLEVKSPHNKQSVFITSGQLAQISAGEKSISVTETSKQVPQPTAAVNKKPLMPSSDGQAHVESITSTQTTSTSTQSTAPTVPASINSTINDSAIVSNALKGKPFPGRGVPFNSQNHPVFGSGGAPGNSGNAPGHSGGSPGNSGNAPGHNK